MTPTRDFYPKKEHKLYDPSAPFIIGPGMSVDYLLDRFSKDELKDLFKEAFRLLTRQPAGELVTPHETMRALLGKIKGECKLEGAAYFGELVNELPHGRGIATYDNKDVYDGDWFNGKRDGWGNFRWSNPASKHYLDTYVGKYRSDLFDGLGTYTHAFGSSYYGCFKEDKKHGPYHYTFADGRAMFGQYVEDLENGPYVWVSSDKSTVKTGVKRNGHKNGEVRTYLLERIEQYEDGEKHKTVQLMDMDQN